MNDTISDDNKHQVYLEEIYDSKCFDKQEMLSWEQQPTDTKTNYNLSKDYFEKIVKATNTYKQNAGGGTAGHNHYKFANQLANIGDKLRKYIQQLASAGAGTANMTNNANNIQTEDKLTTVEV